MLRQHDAAPPPDTNNPEPPAWQLGDVNLAQLADPDWFALFWQGLTYYQQLLAPDLPVAVGMEPDLTDHADALPADPVTISSTAADDQPVADALPPVPPLVAGQAQPAESRPDPIGTAPAQPKSSPPELVPTPTTTTAPALAEQPAVTAEAAPSMPAAARPTQLRRPAT